MNCTSVSEKSTMKPRAKSKAVGPRRSTLAEVCIFICSLPDWRVERSKRSAASGMTAASLPPSMPSMTSCMSADGWAANGASSSWALMLSIPGIDARGELEMGGRLLERLHTQPGDRRGVGETNVADGDRGGRGPGPVCEDDLGGVQQQRLDVQLGHGPARCLQDLADFAFRLRGLRQLRGGRDRVRARWIVGERQTCNEQLPSFITFDVHAQPASASSSSEISR